MANTVLLGLGRWILRLPGGRLRARLSSKARHVSAGLDFMTTDHHRVRNLAVREILATGRPLSPPAIAQKLGLSSERTAAILAELESRQSFLFRNHRGEVSWAYPVTAEATPHRVELETGEQVFAA